MTDKKFDVKPVLPEGKTYDDLRAHAGPRPWYVYGLLLARSVTMLLGKGAAGKTMMALAIALCVCAGRAYAPWWKVKRVASGRKVLLLMAEDDKKEIERRCLAIALVLGIRPEEWAGKLCVFTPKDGEDLDIKLFRKVSTARGRQQQFEVDPTEIAKLLPTLIKEGDYAFVVVDPLREAHDAQENSNDEMTEVMKRFREVARVTDTPMMIVHHDGKGDETSDSSSGGRGASSIGWLARVNVRLIAMDDDSWGELKHRLTTAPNHLSGAVGAGRVGEREEYYQVVSGKVNYGPKAKGRWVRMLSVDVGITDEDGDPTHLGVPVPVDVGATDLGLDDWAHRAEFLAMVSRAFDAGAPYSTALGHQSALMVDMARKFGADKREAAQIVEAFAAKGDIVQVRDAKARRQAWALPGQGTPDMLDQDVDGDGSEEQKPAF